ncbi:MAG: hypothetical protein ACRDRO_21165 [Pseudonocardiaceae bacterium]
MTGTLRARSVLAAAGLLPVQPPECTVLLEEWGLDLGDEYAASLLECSPVRLWQLRLDGA